MSDVIDFQAEADKRRESKWLTLFMPAAQDVPGLVDETTNEDGIDVVSVVIPEGFREAVGLGLTPDTARALAIRLIVWADKIEEKGQENA